MQAVDPGERRDGMGARQDGAGMGVHDRDTAGAAAADGDWDAAPQEQKMPGTGSTRHPGQESRAQVRW